MTNRPDLTCNHLASCKLSTENWNVPTLQLT